MDTNKEIIEVVSCSKCPFLDTNQSGDFMCQKGAFSSKYLLGNEIPKNCPIRGKQIIFNIDNYSIN